MSGPGRPDTGRPTVPTFAVGDRVTLRKTHPCGAVTWLVTRTGADIGLACEGCGRRVLLERRVLESRLR